MGDDVTIYWLAAVLLDDQSNSKEYVHTATPDCWSTHYGHLQRHAVLRCVEQGYVRCVAERYDASRTSCASLEIGLKAYIITAIRLRYDYDEKLTCSFFARVEWKQARAIRRSRIVVVSQSNLTHIVILIISVVVECVVASSYRSHVAVESQL